MKTGGKIDINFLLEKISTLHNNNNALSYNRACGHPYVPDTATF